MHSIRIKDDIGEQRLFERRAIIAAVVVVLAFGLVLARLTWLQVIQHDYFAELSQGNRIRIEPIPPNRGLILDRNGLPLATNVPSYQLELTPERVPDLDAALAGLTAMGLLQADEIPELTRAIRGSRRFDSVPIRFQLNDVELARFAAHQHHYPGIQIHPRLTRFYPLGISGVHAIGYVGIMTEEEQKTLDPSERAGIKLIGKSGIERAYERTLQGRSGFRQVLVNAQGRSVERVGRTPVNLVRQPPLAGSDLLLAIDQRVQQEAEEALRGQRASAVAIDPANGDIIAFVSTPAFDPNVFARGLSRAQYLQLAGDPDRPMYDRALQGVYPPGSTIKPLMALAALQYGVVGAHDTRFCPGVYRLPGVGRPWRDWKLAGHGTVDMGKALATSCDVYFYDLANTMGIDRIADYLKQFGLGAATGIDIPGEKPGILPSTAWKKAAFKRKELQTWYAGDTVSIGIGQGYMTATPLQLAHVTATIAARGRRFKPRLVRAIRNAETGAITELAPSQLPSATTADPGAWGYVIDGMIDVANTSYGGARRMAADAPYLIAAKTGTAQVFTAAANQRVRKAHELDEHLRDHALFIAFAPADAPLPKIAVAVVLENAPGGGGVYAGPIARRIMDTYLLTPEQLSAQKANRQPPPVPPAGPAGHE